MFILESSQTPLHQTCLAGNLQPDLYKSEQSNLSNLAINNCIFMVKHCQVPHLLPIEKAHLRAGRVSYRSALLAVLCPHKGKHMSWPVDSGMLEFLPSHPPLPHCCCRCGTSGLWLRRLRRRSTTAMAGRIGLVYNKPIKIIALCCNREEKRTGRW